MALHSARWYGNGKDQLGLVFELSEDEKRRQEEERKKQEEIEKQRQLLAKAKMDLDRNDILQVLSWCESSYYVQLTSGKLCIILTVGRDPESQPW